MKRIKKIDFFEKKSFDTLSRILLSSFLMISFFYIIPIFINFAEKNLNTKEFTNNSKKILAYTLNSGENDNQNETINEDDILFDIFNLNDLESDTIRLSASTIEQLFEDYTFSLNYDNHLVIYN